jgi:hypothetical protein
MDGEEYDLCRALNGSCSCANSARPPCASIVDLVENDLGEDDERRRMANETADHEF